MRVVVELAVVVPKVDELNAVAAVLDVDVDAQMRFDLGDLYGYFRFESRLGPAVLVCMQQQGLVQAASAASLVLQEFDPSLVVLVGTALGRAGKINHADVVLADSVVDLSERNRTSNRPRIFDLANAVRREVENFATQTTREDFDNAVSLSCGAANVDPPAGPKIVAAALAGVNAVVRTSDELAQIWGSHDRLKAADMECSGVANALKNADSCDLVVVRGISDFGDDKDAQEGSRSTAVISAAVALRMLLDTGCPEIRAQRRYISVSCFFPGCERLDEGVVGAHNFDQLLSAVPHPQSHEVSALLCRLHERYVTSGLAETSDMENWISDVRERWKIRNGNVLKLEPVFERLSSASEDQKQIASITRERHG